MDRLSMRPKLLLAALLLLVMTCGSGCQSMFIFAAYMIHGTDVEAEFKGLKGKKVAVVVRQAANVDWEHATVDKELAHQIGLLLRTNVSKIVVIDHQKVAAWTDEHQWSEYPEVGKALKADMVVGVDLVDFRLYQGQTLYQGRANCNIVVCDMAKDGEVVFEKTMPQSLYPPNSGIPAADKPEPQFRREFIRVLADQIGRHFYSHDPHADIGLDSTVLD